MIRCPFAISVKALAISIVTKPPVIFAYLLHRLSEGGNTVVVIEHNLDVIKTADYIIDIGPEGGDGGGTVIACGTPEEVAKSPVSYTGKYVEKYL